MVKAPGGIAEKIGIMEISNSRGALFAMAHASFLMRGSPSLPTEPPRRGSDCVVQQQEIHCTAVNSVIVLIAAGVC